MKEVVIGICDDLPFAVDELNEIVSNYLERKEYKATILKFLHGSEVIPYMDELDILFLDIEMPDMDGIEVGEQFFQNKSNCKIIMATSRIERFKEAFRIQAFRFVSKPFEVAEVENALEDSLDLMIGTDTIELFENRISYQIQQKDICYVVAYESYVEVMLLNGRKMRKDVSLNKMQDLVDKYLFYRINRKYLVNMSYIEKCNGENIVIDDMKIKIPRVKKKDFEYIFKEFSIRYR